MLTLIIPGKCNHSEQKVCMPLRLSHYAVCTKKVDDGVVVAGEQADEIFE